MSELPVVTDEREIKLRTLLSEMPKKEANYWCDSDACACTGCANVSGGLAKAGFSQEEWRFVIKTPKVRF